MKNTAIQILHLLKSYFEELVFQYILPETFPVSDTNKSVIDLQKLKEQIINRNVVQNLFLEEFMKTQTFSYICQTKFEEKKPDICTGRSDAYNLGDNYDDFDGIPYILKKLVDKIKENHKQTLEQNFFTFQPDKKKVEILQNEIIIGNFQVIDQQEDTKLICYILKKVFYQPLFSSQIVDEMINQLRTSDQTELNLILQIIIGKAIVKLSDPRKKWYFYMIEFFGFILQNQNEQQFQRVIYAFTPCFFQIKLENIKNLQEILKGMIQYQQEIDIFISGIQ